MGQSLHASAESSLDLSGEASGAVTWDLTLSQHTEARVDQLAKEIGGTRDDVFKKAVALLSLAVMAKHEGKRIAIVDSDGNIDTEITGF
jgi:hypothetical protein